MHTIYLYNESFFFRNRIKIAAKNFLGRNFGGPQSVNGNLVAGLLKLGLDININNAKSGPVVCVVNGADVLTWAIEQKKRGIIKKILAGPNIAMPQDSGGIIFNEYIDVLLVPCQWAKDFCLSYCPNFEAKIKIWPSGVKTLPAGEIAKTSSGKCLIYQKNGSAQLLKVVESTLQARSIPYTVVTYGSYSPESYIDSLKDSDFLIFLSQSESQGLALHEAWMMDVPTLVWNGGHMKQGGYEWESSSPAPYLTKDCGMFFSSQDEFGPILEEFLGRLKNFHPRNYHLSNFTETLAAKKYLEILYKL